MKTMITNTKNRKILILIWFVFEFEVEDSRSIPCELVQCDLRCFVGAADVASGIVMREKNDDWSHGLSAFFSICHRMDPVTCTGYSICAKRTSHYLQFNGTLLLCFLQMSTLWLRDSVCNVNEWKYPLRIWWVSARQDNESTSTVVRAKFSIGFVGVDVKIIWFSLALSHCSQLLSYRTI